MTGDKGLVSFVHVEIRDRGPTGKPRGGKLGVYMKNHWSISSDAARGL